MVVISIFFAKAGCTGTVGGEGVSNRSVGTLHRLRQPRCCAQDQGRSIVSARRNPNA